MLRNYRKNMIRTRMKIVLSILPDPHPPTQTHACAHIHTGSPVIQSGRIYGSGNVSQGTMCPRWKKFNKWYLQMCSYTLSFKVQHILGEGQKSRPKYCFYFFCCASEVRHSEENCWKNQERNGEMKTSVFLPEMIINLT